MRRATVIVLFLQAVALAGGLGYVRAGSSCCCAKKSGACPLRAVRCNAGHNACSLGTATPAAEERGNPAVIEAAFRLEPRPSVRGDVWNVPRSPIAHVTPPELPPPRRV